jgi:RNA polymerase sigma-70 factor (ECF subfamily)
MRLRGIACAFAVDEESHVLYQEILRRIWESLDYWEGRTIGTWVQRVALNTAGTFRRKAVRSAGAGHEINGRHVSAVRMPHRAIERFMASLGGADRGIFALFLNGASYGEMAQVTGLEQSRLRVKLGRMKGSFEQPYVG